MEKKENSLSEMESWFCTEVSESGHWRDCREVAAEKQCVKISKKKQRKPKKQEEKE